MALVEFLEAAAFCSFLGTVLFFKPTRNPLNLSQQSKLKSISKAIKSSRIEKARKQDCSYGGEALINPTTA